MQKIFLILSGPSGVGKTTALRSLAEAGFSVPKKVTTRPLKSSDNPQELISVSKEEFLLLRQSNQFMVEYDRHGNSYALLEIGNEPSDSLGLIQAIPPQFVEILRQKYSDRFKFISIRLIASEEKILSRFETRNDPISELERQSRIKTVFANSPSDIDYYIDANRPPSEVFCAIMQITDRYKRASRLSFFTCAEISSIRDICRAAATLKTQVSLFGGLAAHIYGANRIATDIDIIVDTVSLLPLANILPSQKLNEVSDNKITFGRVDVRRSPVRIGDKELGQVWHYDDLADKKSKKFIIQGLDIGVISPEDILVMKGALQRGKDRGKFDVEDAFALLEKNHLSLDWNYIKERSVICHVQDRVMPFIESSKKLIMNGPNPIKA